MDSQNNNPRRRQAIRLFFVLCSILIACVMVYTTQKVVNQGMKNHQLQMLDMVTDRITENMNYYFQRQWENIQYVRKALMNRSFADEDEVLKSLGEEEDSLRENYRDLLLFLIDKDGFFYSAAGGRIALWRGTNTAFASAELDRNRSVTISSLAELASESREYLCFTQKLEKPLIAADGSYFTHMVLATDKSIFDIDLSLSSFGAMTDAFIMNSQGKIINAQEQNTNLAKAYNLSKTLEQAKFFSGNTYEEMKTALETHMDVISMIRFEGVDYYISFKYMGIEDWYAVFLVDQRDMSSNVEQIMYQMSLGLAVGFVLIGIVLGLFLFYNTQIYLREERRNKEQLRVAMEAANQANQAKSEFLSRMSHDIRTPLGGIIGMTDMAAAKADDKAELMECLRKIRNASKHLQTLVNEVLDIARIESGKITVNEEAINLQEAMAVVHDIIESRAASRNQSYEIDMNGIIHPIVVSDAGLLTQILLNLLGNSVKYTPEGGCIRFKLFEETLGGQSAKYHFIVSDNGIGMKPEFLERIYERFSQETISARSSYEGTGLGMAIVKEFVDLLGGAITIESEVNAGTTFEVIFTFQFLEETERGTQENVCASGEKRSYHILLAEDNDINRDIAVFILAENGMSCVAVEDGRQLTEVFRRSNLNEFDAILTDIRMPVLDGLEAAKIIRSMKREDAGTIPIIAMTANAYNDDKTLSLNAGMNAHLTKPLDAEQMIKTLNQLCGI